MPYMTDIEDIEVFWVHAVPNSRGNIVEDYMGRMLGHGLWVFLGPLCKLSCTLVQKCHTFHSEALFKAKTAITLFSDLLMQNHHYLLKLIIHFSFKFVHHKRDELVDVRSKRENVISKYFQEIGIFP